MFQCNLSQLSCQYDDSINQVYKFLLISALLFEDTWKYFDKELEDLSIMYERVNWAQILGIHQWDSLVPNEIDAKHLGNVSAKQKKLYDILINKYNDFVKAPPQIPLSLSNNLALLNKSLNLTEAEQLALVVATVNSVYDRHHSLFELLKLPLIRNNRTIENASYIAQFLASISSCSLEDCKKALQAESSLLKFNLFDNFVPGNDNLENFFDFNFDFHHRFLVEQTEITELLGMTLEESSESNLSVSDFDYLNPKLSQTLTYLDSAMKAHKTGVNILLYGSPGTGKTELSKVIASAVNANLFESPVVDQQNETMIGDRRVRLMKCLAVLKKDRNGILLVDEAQDIFQNFDIFNFHQDNPNKGFINKLLETNENPVIWITNSIEQMDPAYLRRFDLCLEVEVPPKEVREKIIQQKAKGLSEKLTKALSERTDIAPAVIEQSANFAKEVSEKQGSDMEKVFVEHLNSTLSLMHKPAFVQNKYSFTTELYDPSLSTADADLLEMVDGIKEAEAARLCLYGVPGTGKTAWAQHLGKCLNRPVLVKRCSDLLDCYVGNSEKRIAAAFAEAKRNDAILVLDEADSFLQKRSGAHLSWEVTQVNEMLTQIEHFDGIFVATTNNLDQMDEACLRRFDIKVKFDYLKADKAEKLFVNYCEKLYPDQTISDNLKNQVRKMAYLAPGDFATVANQSRFRRIDTPEVLLQRLEKECEVKLGHSHLRSIGF